MAGSHRARLAVFGVIGLVVALAAPASAASVPGAVVPTPASSTMPPPEWRPARCATGAITDVRQELDQLGDPVLWLSGWIEQCAGTGFSNGFTVIRYYGGSGIRSRIVPYYSPFAPTTFTFRVDGLRFILQPNMTALCVAYNYEGRAACLGVDVGDPGEQPVVTPISTDDPRVLVGSRREMVYPSHPTCGTCL